MYNNLFTAKLESDVTERTEDSECTITVRRTRLLLLANCVMRVKHYREHVNEIERKMVQVQYFTYNKKRSTGNSNSAEQPKVAFFDR